jgi:hypothetical protein
LNETTRNYVTNVKSDSDSAAVALHTNDESSFYYYINQKPVIFDVDTHTTPSTIVIDDVLPNGVEVDTTDITSTGGCASAEECKKGPMVLYSTKGFAAAVYDGAHQITTQSTEPKTTRRAVSSTGGGSASLTDGGLTVQKLKVTVSIILLQMYSIFSFWIEDTGTILWNKLLWTYVMY